MDLDTRIRKLARAVKYCKPDKCEGCKFIHYDSFASSCTLTDRSNFDDVINYELKNGTVAPWCPLLEKDSEEYKELREILELLVELKASRIKLQEIEKITREAFNNPETQDIDLYRAQALANILAVFEYDGATIKEEG
jgi:hypothetical protein